MFLQLVSQANNDSAIPANAVTSPLSHPSEDHATEKQTLTNLTEDKTETDKTKPNLPLDETRAVRLPGEEAKPVSLSPDNNTHHTLEAAPNDTNKTNKIPSVSSQLEHSTVDPKQQTVDDEEPSPEGEVCYYYDSSKYDQVLRDTYKAAVKDCIDGDDITIVQRTPNLDQIINGHPLRMYKRTAKVSCFLCMWNGIQVLMITEKTLKACTSKSFSIYITCGRLHYMWSYSCRCL